ncbi:MAG: ferrous iron transport protein B [Candidatus Infernicultor aquiphilus]|uniref:Ferrous iron transport protein B n=3 Tax=Candidatus Infernicultor aquiphilus TaxID=1805029 RepID=A0A1J5GHT6_9BACT|nr:MAG: ferrous iron transport protein B [Candidatus Atribacteria bacterium CG2_30_33_13]PIW12178.1 MAG: ferrous iron transport protein B [Candidatus Atribacteria bacterium CG17_big_fil_post_rev_8_21_14_2_50_34_11]PIX34511.1 MAG: ferrous iron transport protein B [Candidatus Atribacteria bacterium CG_4_8_14_3_um_filter_34_18]PJB55798.1 MAG: ferrous iron transport protein B [Candidatus Atribacteria bacterium CG_4_9_14_3_um_filter_33_16]
MKIALMGQQNSGKSTIFNSVAGYKAVTSNFPGKTVTYNLTKFNLFGQTLELVDLPGTYSLTSFDLAELEARKYLLKNSVDVVIDVIDASLLSRSLELTLQLLELKIPMVICLNMIDEADRKGIKIDIEKLSKILDVPVVPVIAVKGKGIKELFSTAYKMGEKKKIGKTLNFSKDVEEVIEKLSAQIKEKQISKEFNVPERFLAIKYLENDRYFMEDFKNRDKKIFKEINYFQNLLKEVHGRPPDVVISSERHHLSMNIYESVVSLTKPHASLIDYLDNVLMHPILGYISLGLIFYLFFNLVFKVGKIVEEPLLNYFYSIIPLIGKSINTETLLFSVISGIIQGLAGGIAIVLPYLFPFLFGLAILEDLGYLPRIAFLMDAFLHKIGLHGKAIIPFILGYGCTVPAIMATRILESERDRFITSVLATMIPCAARMTIIFALVAFYISPKAALAIYILNLIVIIISGKILSRLLPEVTPGMILEIPAYHIPSLKVALAKTWLRMKEFIFVAWPLLIAGSTILSLLHYFRADTLINHFFSPLTSLLGLPLVVGTTLIFGILRKELSMLMLIQALGTANVVSVMSTTQIMTFTVFIIFYIPCVATIAVLWREIGSKRTLFTIAFTFILAIILATITRFVY